MSSEVFFVNMRARSGHNLLDKLERLFERAGFKEMITPGDLVAIKIHFGERGNLAYIRPQFLRRLVEKIRGVDGKPFLTDANTLYVGSRANAIDHLETALENGFAYSVVGAPLIIADGLNGKDYEAVKINQRYFEDVKIGSAIFHANTLFTVSHFKGHEITGFGGAIKNLGMGSGARSGKQMMHSDVKPRINLGKCIGCGKCLEWCPAEAISLFETVEKEPSVPAVAEAFDPDSPAAKKTYKKKALINHEKCIGCGECVVTCPVPSIKISWKTTPSALQEKMAEYALGVMKNKVGNAGLINFLTDISPDCDCFGWNDAPIVGNIGILASRDPVAIDQASVDLVNQQPALMGSVIEGLPVGQDKFRAVQPEIDWAIQLAYGEQIGLGSRKYRLINV
ncbi:MAG: DUF362 domain-containing protein [Syntrophomonadaceae bacterium]|nr:DUF362 domain-containing protein [Syntrophomonadaceae bacterium]